MDGGSNTAINSDGNGGGKKKSGRPFVKGDPRINRKGRPKSFDQFRALALQIGSEAATTPDGKPILWNGKPITWSEYVLRTWLTDKRFIEKFTEVAFGKVPQAVDVTSRGEKLPAPQIYLPAVKVDDEETDGG
jgi:hypothetical protein